MYKKAGGAVSYSDKWKLPGWVFPNAGGIGLLGQNVYESNNIRYGKMGRNDKA
jgi:hypothetical protein